MRSAVRNANGIISHEGFKYLRKRGITVPRISNYPKTIGCAVSTHTAQELRRNARLHGVRPSQLLRAITQLWLEEHGAGRGAPVDSEFAAVVRDVAARAGLEAAKQLRAPGAPSGDEPAKRTTTEGLHK